MTITEFLLARILEDEDIAYSAAAAPDHELPVGMGHAMLQNSSGAGSTRRVLAEAKAKRAIIEAVWSDHERIESEWGTGKHRAEMESLGDHPESVTAMAQVYAGHPDYDTTWSA